MPRAGGEADKLGNHFESVWTVNAALDVYRGEFEAITVEAGGEDGAGVEFHLDGPGTVFQFHSVKRQKQGGEWTLTDLCRPSSSGRSILGDLIDKVRRYPEASSKFVSETGANDLRELIDRARAPEGLPDFYRSLSDKLEEKFSRQLVPLCENDVDFAFRSLKSLEVIPRGHSDLIRDVDRRLEGLFYRLDGADLDPGDLRREFAELILFKLGRRIDKRELQAFLDEQEIGSRGWSRDRTIQDRVERLNRSLLRIAETELINGTQIPRKHVAEIRAALTDGTKRGALLVASAGYGKSCVLAQVVSQLAAEGVPHLCLRMDSFEPCSTAKQLAQQRDLPASPAVVLAGLAQTMPSVLVVDQLDAMSIVSGRSPQLWDAFAELCEDARAHPNVKLVLACRDFDLQHDPRLRTLARQDSGFSTIKLGKLDKSEIEAALTTARQTQSSMSEKQLEVLSVPFQLLLFLEGSPSAAFRSVNDLYQRFSDLKRQKLQLRLGRPVQWNAVVSALSSRMSERQTLFCSKDVVDAWAEDAQAMVSEHILVDTGTNYRFFHESFFDYVHARHLCSSGKSLLKFLLDSEQHLFRRAQVRQVLTYRRESDTEQYLRDLRETLLSDDVRFHLRRMIASGLMQIEAPIREEWEIISPHLLEGPLARFLSIALRNHLGWFHLLDSLEVWENWLASPEEQLVNAALWYLESPDLHAHHSSRIAALMLPHANDPNWTPRLQRIMSWGHAHKSPEMIAIFMGLLESGAYDNVSRDGSNRDFWSDFHDAETEVPKFIIDVVARWFDRAVERSDDGETRNLLDQVPQNHSHTGALLVGSVAGREPDYFVRTMLPRVLDVVHKTEFSTGDSVRNRTWTYLSNHGDAYDIDDAILLHLRKSLQWMALNDQATHRVLTREAVAMPHQTVSYLLLRSWAENPIEFANDCADYLVADTRRLDVGYATWSGGGEGTGRIAITRAALEAISPHCDANRLLRLEEAIREFFGEYEEPSPQWRGYTELLALTSLDQSRISKQSKSRIDELNRKFPGRYDPIVPEDANQSAICVVSPISPVIGEIMTDDQWISAMGKYKHSKHDLRGGPVELSRMLSSLARKYRLRFASLVHKMPDGLNPAYFSGILEGLSGSYSDLNAEEKELDQQDLAATPTEVFEGVIDRLHHLEERPCGREIAGCIRALSDRSLSPRTLEVISYYAVSDPDPEPDVGTSEITETQKPDVYTSGINSVRGNAAVAIGDLLFDDPSRWPALKDAVESLVRDSSHAVQSCAIRAVQPVLNFARDEAVRLFLRASDGGEPIWTSPPFERFIYWSVHTHYAAVRGTLMGAMASTNGNAVEVAARQVILAELSGVNVGMDAQSVRGGNNRQRRAAADIYAANLKDKDVGPKCEERLMVFAEDSEESVRKEVAQSFANLDGDRLLELKNFISSFIESPSFVTEPEHLLHALERSTADLPDVVCRAAERILEFLGEEGTHIAYHRSTVGHGISTLIVRQYQQAKDDATRTRCLDLIDRIEKVGYLGISEELNRAER